MTQQYTVVVASDGLEGMTQFNKQSFDLVLLDVMMPNLNGFEVAKMIQKSVKHTNYYANCVRRSNEMRFDLGIDDYITKPFSFHVLIRRVRSCT